MHSLKKTGVLLTAILAICACCSATASAKFTSAVAPNKITGGAIENHVFTTASGNVTCTEAKVEGTVEGVEWGEQGATVTYGNCKANGVATAHVSAAKYLFTTNLAEPTKNQVHILNTITITVTKTILTPHCTITIGPQTLGTVHYINETNGVIVEPTITGIHYVPTGNPCGTKTETNGTTTGKITIMGESGAISVDD